MQDDRLVTWFGRAHELGAVIESVLEGRHGRVTVSGDAARLSVGCYEIFGGDPASSEARDLIAGAARPRELVYLNDPAWRRLILEVHGSAVEDRPMRDYDPRTLDPAVLRQLEEALPTGVELRAFDLALAGQLDAGLEPHALQVFEDAQDFVDRGLGFGAVIDGRLTCAATSYTRSSRSVEVAISTREDFRGRGIAAVTAARLLRACLSLGLAPRWSASNLLSQRLAVRLGFHPAGVCEVLYLR
ncbi:MAG TPA: GNAT family N-acetyltransferase [Candidatus Polarisedimenticolaceae bacterium]|nr:GNAT family N-acetyltransferase [Candidatus Polarisedimenticolaceae bacterium]